MLGPLCLLVGRHCAPNATINSRPKEYLNAQDLLDELRKGHEKHNFLPNFESVEFSSSISSDAKSKMLGIGLYPVGFVLKRIIDTLKRFPDDASVCINIANRLGRLDFNILKELNVEIAKKEMVSEFSNYQSGKPDNPTETFITVSYTHLTLPTILLV